MTTQPTLTLTAFLEARIGEDEAVAREATPGPWRWVTPSGDEFPTQDESLVSDGRSDNGAPVEVLYGWGYDASGIAGEPADREHIARHDPARILAECEAKRQIVELAEIGWSDGLDPATCRKILEVLALPYADHPDYREEWRP